MDKIEKALQRLTPKERKVIKEILVALAHQQIKNFDIKKLKGRDDIFRIRKGRVRIIYRVSEKGAISILAIERRSDTTYNF